MEVLQLPQKYVNCFIFYCGVVYSEKILKKHYHVNLFTDLQAILKLCYTVTLFK